MESFARSSDIHVLKKYIHIVKLLKNTHKRILTVWARDSVEEATSTSGVFMG